MKIKSFDRKKELQEAAFDEFISKSYEEASLNNIIKNAGISKGTFYYHFRDKEALYLSLIQGSVEAKMEFLKNRIQENAEHGQAENGQAEHEKSKNQKIDGGSLNLFETLKLQAKFGIEFAKEYPRYYLFGMMFLREKGNKIYDTAMAMLDDSSEKYYDSMLEQAYENKDLRGDISISFVKKIISYIFIHYDEIFDVKEDMMDFDLMRHNFDQLIDFMQYGLGRKTGDQQK